MLRALGRLIAKQLQLTLELEPRPRSAHELKRVLVRRGLDEQRDVRLTENRTVLVSFSRDEIRLHRGYLDAPDGVLEAIVRFVNSRTRRERATARRELLEWEIPSSFRAKPRPRTTRERTHPADEKLARALAEEHAALNSLKFDAELSAVPIRVSRRMKSRLGHYTWRGQHGHEPEIVISRRHIRAHGWDEVVHTLLHEMVHQWQDERGLPVDHGREFRRKARAVGIAPVARRDVA